MRSRADSARIELVDCELLPGRWIKNRDRCPVVITRRRKISAPLRQRRHRRERVKGIAPSRAVPSAKKEGLLPAVVNLRDVQRPAQKRAEMRLIVAGLGSLKPGQRIWTRVENRVAILKIEHAMRLVDVEAARHTHHHDSSAARTTGAARTAG